MKIGIDAGHGINTAGKRCAKEFDVNETREWLLNSRVATKVCDLLRQYGVETLRLDDITGNTDIGLNTRVRNANNENVDFVLSIHHNAGGGTGIETYVYNQACLNGKSGEIARILQVKAVEKTGMRDRGVKTGNFAIIRDTKMPACLVECGFMDNASDTPRILTEEYANIVVNALVEGLVEYFGLTKQEGQTVVENATVGENPTVQTYTYKDFVGDVQRACGAKVDFIAGPETLSKTVTVSTTKNRKHAVVKPLQRYLNVLGFDCGVVDGIAGKLFDNAVKSYQRANSCVCDGEITARNKTWKKLLKLA